VILFVHCFGDFFRKEELEMNVDKGVKQSSHQRCFDGALSKVHTNGALMAL
jgi:ornithine carbamoyltransferase